MKYNYFLVLFTTFCFSQNEKKAIILDKDDKQAIEFVNIYNSKDFTTSNEDGKFSFNSALDSIYFYKVGYDKLRTTFDKIQDTVYLEKSVFELAEVVVTNKKGLFQNIKDSLKNNYSLEPYSEKFLLRGVLKYNDSIVRIQDIQGKLKRKTLLYTSEMGVSKKDYEVEITNMRKIGILKDDNNAYFIFPSFSELLLDFIPINVVTDYFDLYEQPFEDGTKIKWDFASNYPDSLGTVMGNYIINAKNYAIEYFELNRVLKKDNYQTSANIKFRTDNYRTKIYLSKDKRSQKYCINYAKSNVRVEITNAENSFTSFYDIEFILTTSDNFQDMKVKSNINENKDIFKLDYQYNSEFWKEENQLLLTREMTDFIKKLKSDDNEFKIKSNF